MHIPHPREIRAARLEICLSQKEAADIVGVSEDDWLQWETNPMFSSYEIMPAAAWNKFLRETEPLRPEDSGFDDAINSMM